MTSLIMSFLIVLVLPLLMATWRMSLVGLALQGILMGAIVLQRGVEPSLDSGILLADLFLVRGLLVPWIFWRILQRRNTPSRNDVIPANLLSWMLLGVLVVVAFRFGRAMAWNDPRNATQISVAAAAVLLGFFVLATQNSRFSQIIGMLRIENGIAMIGLVPPAHDFPLPITIGLTVLFPLTLLTLGGFLARLTNGDPPPPPSEHTL